MKNGIPLLLALFTIICITGTQLAEAQFVDNGDVNKITDIQEMDDGEMIILQGYIVDRLDDDEFLFRDDTGEIEVEIDDDIWQGQPVDPETEVRIYGEIDIDSRTSSIDVETTSVEVERLTRLQNGQQNNP